MAFGMGIDCQMVEIDSVSYSIGVKIVDAIWFLAPNSHVSLLDTFVKVVTAQEIEG